MKKVTILALLMLCLTVAGFSQRKLTIEPTSKVTLDTNTNTVMNYLYTPVLSPNAFTSVRFIGTKISGQVTGSVALQYALDTTGFAAGTATWFTASDSLTLADVTTNNRVWYGIGHARLIRLRVNTNTNAQSLQIAGLFIRK